MHGAEYFIETLVRDRHAQLRDLAERCALRRALREPRRPLRVRLGLALIRGGRWLARRRPAWSVAHRRPA
jgi:hypothetical protein